MSGDDFGTLIKQVREGSESAAWTLVETYGPYILRTVRQMLDRKMRTRLDSQDFVQAVWASLFARPQRLRNMVRPDELVAYLTTVTRNNVIQEARKQRDAQKRAIHREVSLDDPNLAVAARDAPSREPTPSQVAIARELWERMCRNQPPHYRRIIALRLHGQTYQAIAEKLGLSERTVRRVLSGLLRNRVPDIENTRAVCG